MLPKITPNYLRNEVQELYYRAVADRNNLNAKDTRTLMICGNIAALKVVIAMLDMLRITACSPAMIDRCIVALETLEKDCWPPNMDKLPAEVRQTMAGKKATYQYFRNELIDML